MAYSGEVRDYVSIFSLPPLFLRGRGPQCLNVTYLMLKDSLHQLYQRNTSRMAQAGEISDNVSVFIPFKIGGMPLHSIGMPSSSI